MFASASIIEHLARGVIGIGALAFGVTAAPAHPWALVFALPVAIYALRGCPTCWTIGLVETVARRVRGENVLGACADGSCIARGRGSRSRTQGARLPR